MSETTNQDNPQDERDLLADALLAAGHGVWHWNLLDGSAWYSVGFRKMLGFTDSAEFSDRFEAFASRVHSDDIGRVHHAVATHLDGNEKFDLEFRMRTKDGAWSWFRARGRSVVENGNATKMLGTLTEWPLSSARDQLAASASDKLAAALHDQSQSSRALEKANQELQRARAIAEAA